MSPRAATQEPEIEESTKIATPDGRLRRPSVGFSRTPLFDGHIDGRWGRRKRWEYWAVLCRTHLVSLTIADLDYVGLVSAWFIDLQRNERIEVALPVPPGMLPGLPDRVAGGDVQVRLPGLVASIRESVDATRLAFSMRTVGHSIEAEIEVEKPRGHESLSVLVPFSEDAFQLTSKHVARPATGSVVVDGKTFAFDAANESYGTLDFGRGIFPHRTRWNWSAAAGRIGDRTIGWNLGGQWTDGTGVTENGLFVDGKLHKIGDDVRFVLDFDHPEKSWRISSVTGGAVDLELEPLHVKRVRGLFLPVGADLWLAFGRFRGTLHDASGERIEIREHVGWAEELHARW